jgi:hypothetical protein
VVRTATGWGAAVLCVPQASMRHAEYGELGEGGIEWLPPPMPTRQAHIAANEARANERPK